METITEFRKEFRSLYMEILVVLIWLLDVSDGNEVGQKEFAVGSGAEVGAVTS